MVTYLLFFNKRPRIALSPRTRRPAHAMDVLAHIDRGIVADYVRDVAYIDTAGDQVGTHKSTKIDVRLCQ